MNITVIQYNDMEHHIECESFEFSTYQVANCIRIKYHNGNKEIIHGVATIKAKCEAEDSDNLDSMSEELWNATESEGKNADSD